MPTTAAAQKPAPRARPPFRADQVGSLLRPQRLKDARERLLGPQTPDQHLGPHQNAELTAIEDGCVRDVVAMQERVGLPFTIGSSGADEAAEIRVQLPQGVLDVLAPQHRLFSYTAFVFIGWVIGVPIVLTWIAIIFMRNQVRPIRRLAVAAESFGRGVDTVRLRPAGALEVRQAAAAFIVMTTWSLSAATGSGNSSYFGV